MQGSRPAAGSFVKRARVCVYGTGSDLTCVAFLKGLDSVQGIITEETLSISLADCMLEIVLNQQCFYLQKVLKVIYLFLLEMAPLAPHVPLDPVYFRFSDELMERIRLTPVPGRLLL